MEGVAEVQALIDQYNAVMAKWSEPDADYEAIGAEQAALEDRINAADAWNVERNVEIAMEALRCPPDDAASARCPAARSAASRSPGSCSSTPTCCSSTSRRTTSTPSPSSGWSASSTSTRAPWSPSPTTATSSTTSPSGSWSWTAGGGIPFEGNYSGWLEQKLERLAREQKQADARERTLARELEWVRMGAKARQAKGKARLTAYESLLAEANDARGLQQRELEIAIPPGPRLGDQVIEVHGLRKGYGDRLLIDDLTFSLPRAGIVGIIGPNGAGKTTLFRMLVGQEAPDAGSIEIGDTVVHVLRRPVARRSLRAEKTRVPGDHPGRRGDQGRPARGAGARVRLVASTSAARTSRSSSAQLSGGERNRVHLAKLLQSGGNVLLLDEPTNDLDVDTLRALEAGLEVVPRLRRRHQPRPLVPRPDRDPHPRVRGRQPGPLLPGQRQRLRGVPPQGARRRSRPAAPDPVQAPRRLGRGGRPADAGGPVA